MKATHFLFFTFTFFAAPSFAEENEWNPRFENASLKSYVTKNVKVRHLGYFEANPPDGNVAGTANDLQVSYDFSFLSFDSVDAARTFVEKSAPANAPYVSLQVNLGTSANCNTIETYEHFWQGAGSFLRSGIKLYGETGKRAVELGIEKKLPQEKTELLASQKFCAGENLGPYKIVGVRADVGLNLSTALGATYPTYPVVLLADAEGHGLVTTTSDVRRLQRLHESGKVSARGSSGSHKCEGSVTTGSDVKKQIADEAIAKAMPDAAEQCRFLGKELDVGSVKTDVHVRNICFETGSSDGSVVLTGSCR
jgi:hypothetical protein